MLGEQFSILFLKITYYTKRQKSYGYELQYIDYSNCFKMSAQCKDFFVKLFGSDEC